MKCRICQSLKTSHFTKVDKWELRSCDKCGFVQVINKPTLNELHQIYSADYFDNNKYRDSKTLFKEYEYRINLVKQFLPKNSSILDYGCAKGDFIIYSKNYFNLKGIDFSDDAIKQGRKEYSFLQDKLLFHHQLDKIPDNSLNGIIMWDVIEHIWDPNEAISPLLSKLKQDGYVFLSTPKVDSFMAKTLKKFWPFMTPPEHLSFFSYNAFQEFASLNNLDIVKHANKGKWVNIGFLLYKIKRILPQAIPTFLIDFFNRKSTANLAVYAPTYDIQYLVLKKLPKD